MPNALNLTADDTIRNGRPYDDRIGNGALPAGITGSANLAYVRTPQAREYSGNQVSDLLSSDNPYIRNARMRGMEVAGARGNLNSSMAAGASQRAAIEAAAPFALQQANAETSAASDNQQYLNQLALEDRRNTQSAIEAALQRDSMSGRNALDLQMQRERLAFEGEQGGLNRAHQNYRDRTGYNYDLGRVRAGDQSYARRTGIDMRAAQFAFRQRMMQAAFEDPELYTPEDIEGFSATFDPWMEESMNGFDQYFNDYWGDF